MTSRSDCEPLPKPTLSPFTRGYLSLCRFFTAAVWCVPALRVPLVHSLINHFRQKKPTPSKQALAHAGTFLCVGFSLPPCGVCLLCGCRWFIL